LPTAYQLSHVCSVSFPCEITSFGIIAQDGSCVKVLCRHYLEEMAANPEFTSALLEHLQNEQKLNAGLAHQRGLIK